MSQFKKVLRLNIGDVVTYESVFNKKPHSPDLKYLTIRDIYHDEPERYGVTVYFEEIKNEATVFGHHDEVVEVVDKRMTHLSSTKGLKKSLIRLGAKRPSLRKHLGPILDRISQTDIGRYIDHTIQRRREKGEKQVANAAEDLKNEVKGWISSPDIPLSTEQRGRAEYVLKTLSTFLEDKHSRSADTLWDAVKDLKRTVDRGTTEHDIVKRITSTVEHILEMTGYY